MKLKVGDLFERTCGSNYSDKPHFQKGYQSVVKDVAPHVLVDNDGHCHFIDNVKKVHIYKPGDTCRRIVDSAADWTKSRPAYRKGFVFTVAEVGLDFVVDTERNTHNLSSIEFVEPIVVKATSALTPHIQQIGRGLRPNRLTAQDWIDDHRAAQRLINRYGLEGAKKLLEGLSDDD